MKRKIFILLSVIFSSYSLNSQTNKGILSPSSTNGLFAHEANVNSLSQEKTLLCLDTLRYPQVKEQVLGASTFFVFNVWASDNESISQTFLNSGPLSIAGVEFFGSRNTGSAATVVVNAAIYNVNASNVPTTLVGSGNVTVSSTVAGYVYVSFASPLTVTGNYAIVLAATNANGILDFYVNNTLTGQSYDEDFTRYKSAYYPNSSNSYVSIPVLTTGDATNFQNTLNFEPLVAPIVNYTINTNFATSALSVCQGTPITYTNTSTPIAAFSNRMMNYQVFRSYFGTAIPDSTYVYDMDNLTPYIWSANTTYTHPNAGTYDVLLATNGGFWNSCFDFKTTTITVNAIPNAPVIVPTGVTTFCSGGSVILTSSSSTGNLWSTGATTQAITVNNSSTITVSSTVNGCASQSSIPQVVSVVPLANANFNYPNNSICSSSSNQIPTTSVAGSFSSVPAGLTFVNSTTGEINVAGSATGTYTVTYNTTGTCPNQTSQSITITSSPDATFTYPENTFCSNLVNPSPIYGAGASGGVFSSTNGLVFVNANTGVIDLSSSANGSYIVTNTIASIGSCIAVPASFSITILQVPSASISGGGNFCVGEVATIAIQLTGVAPWSIIYSDGSINSTINTNSSPYTFNTTNNGTFTISSVASGGCTAVGNGTAAVEFNSNPTVTVEPIAPLCENSSALVLTASPVGGVFSGTGVSSGSFDPTIGAGSYTVTYNYTDENGCAGSDVATILVNSSPLVSQSQFTEVCSDVVAFSLLGGLPLGGVYSGLGVTNGMFDPAVAGIGSTAITYSFTDNNGCSSSATESILVNDCAGLNELETMNMMVVPNPASTILTINLFGILSSNATLKMIAEDGKIIIAPHSFVNGEIKLDVSNFARGIYFVYVETEQEMKISKVVLN
jgi:hypothetical protein